MDVMNAIVGRRNIKQFTQEPVPEEKFLSWLEAASFAPNHRMAQPWQVIVIGPETREKLNHKANFGDAPLVVAFLSESAENEMDYYENIVAVSCFVQNFSLAAWADGVGTRWTSIGETKERREVLGVPEGYYVVGILGVGFPEAIPDPKNHTPIAMKLKQLP